jgi:hypothetical protein
MCPEQEYYYSGYQYFINPERQMNGRVFKTLKMRACFARFLALSTCRNEDKEISRFASERD